MVRTYRFPEPADPNRLPKPGGDSNKGRRLKMAGWWRRVGAWAVEYLVPAKVLGFFLDWNTASAILVLWMAFNSVWMQGRTGQSVGKVLLKIRVVWRIEDEEFDERSVRVLLVQPGVTRCMFRLLAHIFDVLPLMYGFVRPALHHNGQTFADSITQCVVIKDDPKLRIWPALEDAMEDR